MQPEQDHSDQLGDLVDVPAAEVLSAVAAHLVSTAAAKCFRETSPNPDERGEGPGGKLTGPV